MRGIGAILGVLLAIGAAAPAFAAPSPNLPGCTPPEAPDSGEVQRTKPIPVPAALQGILKSSRYHFAVTTLTGGQVCIDTSWWETAEDITLTPDSRFLSFGWMGYESYGHLLVDRTGKGKTIEVGAPPVFSPSRRYFAAADQTESEFGSLSGFAVWQVGPAKVSEIARIQELPRMNDWRVDGWAGESCVNLSALPFEVDPDTAKPNQRVRFRAGPGKAGWQLARSPRGCQVLSYW